MTYLLRVLEKLQKVSKMAEVRFKFNVSMVIAIIAAELVSMLMYTHFTPWYHHIGYRYLISAIIADILLIYIIQNIVDRHWSIRSWEDAAVLSLWLSLLFAGYQAPHVVHDTWSFSYFSYHVLHKFVFTFVLIFVMHSFRKY
ncbi:hypothetical protein KUTeg_016319 [Tegillarca granosa]|uniref:Uncharacterized protein n=1 Tax=Tegillarca granosa TaxID=220873 RepID=A0ABQ9ELI8_TEGGR|nr:hypothetical protein KUTeg_016319 [Tegillarca granosa]